LTCLHLVSDARRGVFLEIGVQMCVSYVAVFNDNIPTTFDVNQP